MFDDNTQRGPGAVQSGVSLRVCLAVFFFLRNAPPTSSFRFTVDFFFTF